MQRHPSTSTIVDRIFGFVVKEFNYFRQNPVHLAWVMMNVQAINRVGRKYDVGHYSSITDSLIEQQKEHGGPLNKADGNLLYDAATVCLSNYEFFPDSNPDIPLESKKNKTMQEWIQIKMNPNYLYNSLYESDYRVMDQLLCVGGSGMGWNPDGFICHQGPCGTDDDIFTGYTRCEKEIEPKVRDRIFAYRKMLSDNPKVGNKLNAALARYRKNAKRIFNGEDYLDVLDARHRAMKKKYAYLGAIPEKTTKRKRQEKPKFYPLDAGSNLSVMPDNADISYIRAGIGVANLIVIDPNSLIGSEQEHADLQYKASAAVATKFLEKWKPRLEKMGG